jgi:hypothetical protein
MSSDDAPQDTTPSPPPSEDKAPKQAGRGVKPLSLVTAVIALGAVGLLIALWVSSPGQQEREAQLAGLEARVAELEQAKQSQGPDLTGDIARLYDQVAALASRERGADGLSEALQAKLNETEQAITSLQAQVAQFDVATEDVNRLTPEALQAAQAEVADLKQALERLSDRSGELSRALAENDVRLNLLEENAPPEGLAEILSSLSAKSDVEALTARLSVLESFNSIEAASLATTALAAADLARAAKGSDPFVNELDAFNIVSPGDASARVLRSFAVSGVATRAALETQFDTVIRTAIEAEKRAKGTRWYSRLWASFTALFDVRKMGEIEGDTTKAIIARAEQRLGDGDLDAVARELAQLKGAAREAMAPWLSQVQARVQVDQLISTLNARVFSSLDESLKATDALRGEAQ